MVSVVVLAYNVEDYILKCIESIRKQTYSQLEIIVVNSDSKDNTGVICQELARIDKRIKYICKKNEGPGAARNMGFSLATYSYITFVDGDDWLELDAIENMINLAKTTEADVVVGDMWYVYANSDNEKLEKKYSKIRFEKNGVVSVTDNQKVSLINKSRTYTCGKLYRTNFLKEIDFRQGNYIYEDVAIVPYLVAKAKIVSYVNKPVYNYLKNRTKSLTNNEKKYSDMLIALNELYVKFQKENLLECYYNELKRLMWGQIRFVCLKKTLINKKDGQILYNDLVNFYKEKFVGSFVPEECKINIYNADFMKCIMDNILLYKENISYIEDKQNIEKRMVVRVENISREFKLDKIAESDLNDETNIWNWVDYLFEQIWC